MKCVTSCQVWPVASCDQLSGHGQLPGSDRLWGYDRLKRPEGALSASQLLYFKCPENYLLNTSWESALRAFRSLPHNWSLPGNRPLPNNWSQLATNHTWQLVTHFIYRVGSCPITSRRFRVNISKSVEIVALLSSLVGYVLFRPRFRQWKNCGSYVVLSQKYYFTLGWLRDRPEPISARASAEVTSLSLGYN